MRSSTVPSFSGRRSLVGVDEDVALVEQFSITVDECAHELGS